MRGRFSSGISANNIIFQNAVKGSLHQSPRITSPATNVLDETRTPTASITDPVGTDYLMAARSTDLTLTSGQDILFDSVFNHSTTAYNPATGLFDTHNEETYTIHAHLVVSTVPGSGLAVNGDFTTDPTVNWSVTNGTIASVAGGFSGNCLQLTRTGGSGQWAYQTPALEVGKSYRLGVYVKSGTSGDEDFSFGMANNAFSVWVSRVQGISSSTWTYYETTFTATETNSHINLQKDTATAGTMLFDQVRLYLDFTIDLVDSANTVIDSVRQCKVGTRPSCDAIFVSHAHTGDRQLKLRVTAGTGNITIKTGSSICVDAVGTEKLRTDLASVTLEWYAQGGSTPLATSAVITKTNGEWPALVTATGLLPSISAIEVLAKGVSTAGFTVTSSARRFYKTKLDKLITLSGLTGTNNLARILVGESSGSVGANFHCNGNSRKFPAAAGDGGDFRFRNSGDTADLVFYVSAISGTTPNRVATCLVAVDAPTGIIIRGEGGPSQASRATAYVATNFAGTGGTRTQVGDDFVHTFTINGNLTIPNGVYTAQALLIAGGGGGGSAIAGGGGAGGYLLNSAVVVSPQIYPVVVGTGGTGGTAGGNGANGTNSTFAGLTAIGGGFGASAAANGGDGGSGGGVRTGNSVGAPTTGQGFGGGWDNASVNGTSGGGGGAGGNGGTAVGSVCGAGGVGLESSITGSPVFRAGGGGGGGYQQGPTTAGAGGTGGGGAGGSSGAGTAGEANTGGGGGGGGYSNTGPTNYAGGAGGSGVVIVRYTPYITTAYASDNG